MESKNSNEIVKHIVDRIKSTQELPYREGAWEDFHKQHVFSPKRKLMPYYWVASAAALLIAGIFTMKYWPESTNQRTNPTLASSKTEVYEEKDQGAAQNNVDTSPKMTPSVKKYYPEYVEKSTTNEIVSSLSPLTGEPLYLAMLNANNYTNFDASIHLPEVLDNSVFTQVNSRISADPERYAANNVGTNDHLLGYQTNSKDLTTNTELKLDQRRFKFNERFNLGLFVSPNSTNENFNFGGGLLLSYNINKNLSVRTGLAFNKYEVGSMRDPVSNTETQIYASSESIQKNTTGSLAQINMNNALIIPNINAITGNVQAFEIPVDLKLKFSKGLYVSSGIAYAVILDQNRYAHYIENANTKIFKNGLPENESQMKSAVMQVTKSIKTEEQNIRTSGFGGFVNLSLGKEVKLKQSFSVSVEPFVKLPVGNFKQSDMNYTNGGIRIITNF